MNEEQIRREFQQAMINVGLEVYHPPDIRQTETARPDILSINGVVVECKTMKPKERIEPWFDPKEISNGQRKHLDYYCWARHFLTFLVIGTLWRPRRLWCIPWKEWVDMEHVVSNHAENLAFRISLSKLEEFPQYELPWSPITHFWVFPEGHPITLAHNRGPHFPSDWLPYSIRFPEEKTK
jgi:hypothetical protein